LAWGSTYDGSFSVSGDHFAFDVNVRQSNTTAFGPFSDTWLIFNRQGTIAALSSSEPNICDRNGDGLIDFLDVLNFSAAASIADPSADVTEPAGVDAQDIAVFVGLIQSRACN